MASLDVFGHGSAVKVSPGEARRVRVSQVGPVRVRSGELWPVALRRVLERRSSSVPVRPCGVGQG